MFADEHGGYFLDILDAGFNRGKSFRPLHKLRRFFPLRQIRSNRIRDLTALHLEQLSTDRWLLSPREVTVPVEPSRSVSRTLHDQEIFDAGKVIVHPNPVTQPVRFRPVRKSTRRPPHPRIALPVVPRPPARRRRCKRRINVTQPVLPRSLISSICSPIDTMPSRKTASWETALIPASTSGSLSLPRREGLEEHADSHSFARPRIFQSFDRRSGLYDRTPRTGPRPGGPHAILACTWVPPSVLPPRGVGQTSRCQSRLHRTRSGRDRRAQACSDAQAARC